MKILMVLTSHDTLGNTGHKTGFWLEEFAAPYFVFKDAGVQLTLASLKGGQPPLDPKSDLPENQTPAMARFKKDPAAQKALANTIKLAEVKAEDFDTVFYPCGHGPMWDLAESPTSIAGVLFEEAQSTLLCSDLFHQNGDVEPLTSADVVGRSHHAMKEYQTGILAEYVSYTPLTAHNLKTLADLKPKTLAIMHGSSFTRDCAQALDDLNLMLREVFGQQEQTIAQSPCST